MGKKVAVLGGGVAGMTAAHELSERGFEVEVFERRGVAGGKARSIPAKGRGIAGLPGEHGFRFFPGFYRHIPDTMKRIPYGGHADGVAGNLLPTTQSMMARVGKPPTVLPDRFPSTWSDLMECQGFFDFRSEGISWAEMARFIEKLFILQASCEERRYQEWENVSWWDFVAAEGSSDGFKKFIADGMTRKLVAAQAKEASARTIGYIMLQLLQNFSRPGTPMDRVLDGPTSEVWIDPWLDHLRRRGVLYHTDTKVVNISCDGSRVSSVSVSHRSHIREVRADYYVAAVPVEIMSDLVKANPALTSAEPRLGSLSRLTTRWMNGIQFYLKRDIPVVHGHTIYADAPYALTSISQQQFWPATPLAAVGDGRCRGVLSVDISDWDSKGVIFTQQTARELSASQIKDEVWAQLKQHLNTDEKDVLEDSDLLGWFLDPDIVPVAGESGPGTGPPNPSGVTNLEPLLVNTAGSWDLRPSAETSIKNLVLASDYVQTFTDLATMEGANEAARRAVNAILKASSSRAAKCSVWPLREPLSFAPLRRLDALRFRLGKWTAVDSPSVATEAQVQADGKPRDQIGAIRDASQAETTPSAS